MTKEGVTQLSLNKTSFSSYIVDSLYRKFYSYGPDLGQLVVSSIWNLKKTRMYCQRYTFLDLKEP